MHDVEIEPNTGPSVFTVYRRRLVRVLILVGKFRRVKWVGLDMAHLVFGPNILKAQKHIKNWGAKPDTHHEEEGFVVCTPYCTRAFA